MKILGLFANQKQAGEAIEEISTRESLKENVSVEISNANEAPAKTAAPAAAPVFSPSGGREISGMGILVNIEDVFPKFNLDSDERSFIERTIQNGGQLVVLETDEDFLSQTKDILEQHDARAIFSAS